MEVLKRELGRIWTLWEIIGVRFSLLKSRGMECFLGRQDIYIVDHSQSQLERLKLA